MFQGIVIIFSPANQSCLIFIVWKLENSKQPVTSSGFIPLGHRGLKFSVWIECPELQGCLGPWVHPGTWCIWASVVVPSHRRLFSQPEQRSHPVEVLQQGLDMFVPLDSPSGHPRWWLSHQTMGQCLRVSALLGLVQGFELKTFMPGAVPGELLCSVWWTTVFSV